MARAMGDLAAIQRAGGGDLSGVLARLRDQADASRLAGLPPLFQLCQIAESCVFLEVCLAPPRATHRPRPKGIVAVLLGVCQAIELHAEAVAKTLLYLSSHDVSALLSAQIEHHLPC